MRRGLAIVLLAACLAGCGGDDSAPDVRRCQGAHRRRRHGRVQHHDRRGRRPTLPSARPRPERSRSTRGGRTSTSSSPAAACRRSSIFDGPFTYTNANVEAAMHDIVGAAVDEARHAPADREAARGAGPTSSPTYAPSPTSPMVSRRPGRSARPGRRRSTASRRRSSAAASTRRASSRRRRPASAQRSRRRSGTTIRRSRSRPSSGSTSDGRLRRVHVGLPDGRRDADRSRRALHAVRRDGRPDGAGGRQDQGHHAPSRPTASSGCSR